MYGFAQHQYNLFNNQFTDGSQNFPASSIGVTGGLASFFIDDKFKVNLVADLDRRPSRNTLYGGHHGERDGPALWLGRQSPAPELGLSRLLRQILPGPAAGDGHRPTARFGEQPELTFAPLHGERDEEHQFGVTIPYRGWALDADTFQTEASNWLDHNNIGESNLFWPITWDAALIQGWELTLRSPRLWHRGQFHLAYSNQIAQATSPITGGLICPTSNDTAARSIFRRDIHR